MALVPCRRCWIGTTKGNLVMGNVVFWHVKSLSNTRLPYECVLEDINHPILSWLEELSSLRSFCYSSSSLSTVFIRSRIRLTLIPPPESGYSLRVGLCFWERKDEIATASDLNLTACGAWPAYNLASKRPPYSIRHKFQRYYSIRIQACHPGWHNTFFIFKRPMWMKKIRKSMWRKALKLN